MELLPRDAVERRFRRIEMVLDRLFEPVIAAAAAEHLNVLDGGNRSGFDMSGYPYFTWERIVQRDEGSGDRIRRAEVRVSYQQPLEDESAPVVIAWTAEIFNRGSLSDFRRTAQTELSLSELERTDMVELVRAGLRTAGGAMSTR